MRLGESVWRRDQQRERNTAGFLWPSPAWTGRDKEAEISMIKDIRQNSKTENGEMSTRLCWNYLLWVTLAACTKQGGSVSLSSSWVKAIRPACSSRPRLSETWEDRASSLLLRDPSRASAKAPWRSATAAPSSRIQWVRCCKATALFACRETGRGTQRVGRNEAAEWNKTESLQPC